MQDAHQDHHAKIGVIPAIDQQGRERRVGVACGRRQTVDQRVQHGLDAPPGLGGDFDRALRVDADDVLDLLLHAVRLGRGEVHLVEHGHDLVVAVHRLVGVGEGLRLDALGRVDHEQRAFARCQRPAHLVGEIHVAGGVHQIDYMLGPIGAAVDEAHGLRLDGNPALALELHRVEHLAGHLALLQTAAALDQPVRKRGLPMVDMGDDRDVADARKVSHLSGPNRPPQRRTVSRAARRR